MNTTLYYASQERKRANCREQVRCGSAQRTTQVKVEENIAHLTELEYSVHNINFILMVEYFGRVKE